MMLSPNSILQGRYRIVQQLGRGGMGAVYQAMDENLNCMVAVKETFAATDEHRRAFKREAELLANLSHGSLPKVSNHFSEGEGQFLVMQYVPGNDLSELMALRGRLFAVEKVLAWAASLLDALEELPSYNPPIIHRDIKPANLKLTPRGKILLLDFGLAKGAAGGMSQGEGEGYGQSVYGYTRYYAPLEQIRGAGTDPRSDLYSLAATLWTLLTAQIPPDALARLSDSAVDGNADPLKPANLLNPDVPVAVGMVLHKAMAINRADRYASAKDMRQALRDAQRAPTTNATAGQLQETMALSPEEFQRLRDEASGSQGRGATQHGNVASPTNPDRSESPTVNYPNSGEQSQPGSGGQIHQSTPPPIPTMYSGNTQPQSGGYSAPPPPPPSGGYSAP